MAILTKLGGLSLSEGFDSVKEKLQNSFKQPVSTGRIREAVMWNDQRAGFKMLEFVDGQPFEDSAIVLVGDLMPHQPFTFGGSQKIVKDYYPGNAEPSVQVLGPRETDITINGRLKSKKYPDTRSESFDSGVPQEDLRNFPRELQLAMEAMRIRGNIIQITMQDFQRFGFIESTEFNMKHDADIEYKINFSIVGINPPINCTVLRATRTVPVGLNKKLISAGTAAAAAALDLPPDFNRGFGDQIADAVGAIASVVNQVTDFVDVALNEVDDVKAALFRATGLIKHAKNTISSQMARIGGFSKLNGYASSANIPPGTGITTAYLSASHIQNTMSSYYGILSLLAAMQRQLTLIRETEPLARHRVKAGDSLQRLASKFYNDATQWTEIYDHNKLNSTELQVGSVIEIPRISSPG